MKLRPAPPDLANNLVAEIEAARLSFVDRLDAEIARHGAEKGIVGLLDCVHKQTFAERVFAGESGLALCAYDSWASSVGRPPIILLSRDPPSFKIGDAVLHILDGHSKENQAQLAGYLSVAVIVEDPLVSYIADIARQLDNFKVIPCRPQSKETSEQVGARVRAVSPSQKSSPSPITSVIMPVHNGARYIAEAMASALVQLDQVDELIVVDDGSTDGTQSVAADVDDPRIRVLSTPRRGVSAARNVGLAAARGEFIAFLDHDDLWPTDRHKRLLRMLEDDPLLDAVFGRIRIRIDAPAIPSPALLAANGLFPQCGMVTCGLYRRRILDRIDGFAEHLLRVEDVDYNLRLMEAGMCVELCDVDSLVYRRHETNLTNDRGAVRDEFFEMLRRKLGRRALAATKMSSLRVNWELCTVGFSTDPRPAVSREDA
jgi:Glycosyl transferase family 2